MAAMLHIEIVYTNEFTLDSGHQRYKDNKNRLTKKETVYSNDSANLLNIIKVKTQ